MIYGSIKQGGLVLFELFENGSHECLPYKATSVGDAVLLAKAIQQLLLFAIKHDGYPMFAGLFCH